MRYRVRLTAHSLVYAHVEVSATSDTLAKVLAVEEAKNGNVTWEYDGVDSSTIEVSQ